MSQRSLAIGEPRHERVLVALVVGELEAGKERVALVQLGDELPGRVAAAVVHKEDAALRGDGPGGDHAAQLCLEALGGLGQHLLLVVAGDDQV